MSHADRSLAAKQLVTVAAFAVCVRSVIISSLFLSQPRWLKM